MSRVLATARGRAWRHELTCSAFSLVCTNDGAGRLRRAGTGRGASSRSCGACEAASTRRGQGRPLGPPWWLSNALRTLKRFRSSRCLPTDSPPTRPVMRRGGGSGSDEGSGAPSLAHTHCIARCRGRICSLRRASSRPRRRQRPREPRFTARRNSHVKVRERARFWWELAFSSRPQAPRRAPQLPQAYAARASRPPPPGVPAQASLLGAKAARCCGALGGSALQGSPLHKRRCLGYARYRAGATHSHGGATSAPLGHRYSLRRHRRTARIGASRAERRGASRDACNAACHRQERV